MSFRTHTLRKGSLRGAAFYDPPTPAAPPVFGETTTTITTLETKIADDPDSYPDGHVVFVEAIDFPDEDGTTVTITGGWVVVYDSVPVPTYFPTGATYGGWLKSYPVPDGITTWVEDEGDGGGFVTSIDGEPVPTTQTGGGVCGASLRTGNNEPTYTGLDLQWESGIEPIDDPPTIDASTVS